MTESISSPWRVYFRTGESGLSARKSHNRLMAELAAVGSSDPGKGENSKPPIRFDDVAEVDRLGIRETDDRRGMKALSDDESFGEMLELSRRSGSTDCSVSRSRRYSGRA